MPGHAAAQHEERASFQLIELHSVPASHGPISVYRRRDKFGLWRPYRIPSPGSPYSWAAMKLTTFDSDCICLTILPTSSFGSLVSERRMR